MVNWTLAYFVGTCLLGITEYIPRQQICFVNIQMVPRGVLRTSSSGRSPTVEVGVV